jgi:hypothetical protein
MMADRPRLHGGELHQGGRVSQLGTLARPRPSRGSPTWSSSRRRDPGQGRQGLEGGGPARPLRTSIAKSPRSPWPALAPGSRLGASPGRRAWKVTDRPSPSGRASPGRNIVARCGSSPTWRPIPGPRRHPGQRWRRARGWGPHQVGRAWKLGTLAKVAGPRRWRIGPGSEGASFAWSPQSPWPALAPGSPKSIAQVQFKSLFALHCASLRIPAAPCGNRLGRVPWRRAARRSRFFSRLPGMSRCRLPKRGGLSVFTRLCPPMSALVLVLDLGGASSGYLWQGGGNPEPRRGKNLRRGYMSKSGESGDTLKSGA